MVTFDFNKTPITQIADAIIIDASNRGASDIHLDPRENGIMTRIRIDGDLVDYAYIPKMYERNLTTRLKLMSNMNITESRLPQDGAIKGKFGDKELDMRVSCLPTNEGEKIVIRILDYSRSLSGLDKLGFNQENYQKLLRMIGNPNGIILITGATGSGKSTTVYSILQALNKEETNIITVEDPIEMNIEGMNQVQVNAEIGLDFAAVLRSILRQDPNVILIGEIRDSETAQIAVRASITGHLVLSTIHTNNSLSTIERLLDMNVERYLLSSALAGIISQRLAKMLCPKCRVKRKTTPYEKKVFRLALKKDIDEIYDANHNGCSYCHKGYRGRIAIQEVLEITEHIKSTINSATADNEKLRKLVYGSGNVITLLQDGLGKVLNGFTTFEEIYRIIEIDNDIEDSCIVESVQEEKEETSKVTSSLSAKISTDKPLAAEKTKESVTSIVQNNANLVKAKTPPVIAQIPSNQKKEPSSPLPKNINKNETITNQNIKSGEQQEKNKTASPPSLPNPNLEKEKNTNIPREQGQNIKPQIQNSLLPNLDMHNIDKQVVSPPVVNNGQIKIPLIPIAEQKQKLEINRENTNNKEQKQISHEIANKETNPIQDKKEERKENQTPNQFIQKTNNIENKGDTGKNMNTLPVNNQQKSMGTVANIQSQNNNIEGKKQQFIKENKVSPQTIKPNSNVAQINNFFNNNLNTTPSSNNSHITINNKIPISSTPNNETANITNKPSINNLIFPQNPNKK